MEPVENRFFIAGLPQEATKKDVEEHFAQFDKATNVHIPLDWTELNVLSGLNWIGLNWVGLDWIELG